MKKKIVVIDDEPLISILMKEIIEDDPHLEITHMTCAKEEFLSIVGQNSFDAALIDISVGGREGGIELVQTMKRQGIKQPVIMLSAHDEAQYALKCLQAGAKGYINKRYICSDVVKCLKHVMQGHLYVSGDHGERILKQYEKLNNLVSVESL